MISIIKTMLIIFVAKAMINLALSKPLVIVLHIVYHHFLSLIINVICIAFDLKDNIIKILLSRSCVGWVTGIIKTKTKLNP